MFKKWFWYVIKKGEGFFTQSISIEQKLWVYCVVVGGAFALGAFLVWVF